MIEDHQFIHIDPERAKRETPFGTTVAHGFLTMSLMSIMSYEVMPVIEGTTMGVNYGFDKLRFISPVRSGSRVRGRFTLMEARLRKPTELLSRTSVSVEIEGEAKPAIVADWLGLIYFAWFKGCVIAGLDPAIQYAVIWALPLPRGRGRCVFLNNASMRSAIDG